MSVNWVSVLSAFLGSAAGAWFAIWAEGWRIRRTIFASLLDLNRRVAMLELDAAAAGAQTAAAALLKKLDA